MVVHFDFSAADDGNDVSASSDRLDREEGEDDDDEMVTDTDEEEEEEEEGYNFRVHEGLRKRMGEYFTREFIS